MNIAQLQTKRDLTLLPLAYDSLLMLLCKIQCVGGNQYYSDEGSKTCNRDFVCILFQTQCTELMDWPWAMGTKNYI